MKNKISHCWEKTLEKDLCDKRVLLEASRELSYLRVR